MSSYLELHYNRDEEPIEVDVTILDRTDSEMEEDENPPLIPQKTFVPKHKITAPTSPNETTYGSLVNNRSRFKNLSRTPAQKRLGTRHGTTNKYFSKNTSQHQPKKTLLPTPNYTKSHTFTRTPHFMKTSTPQYTHTHTPQNTHTHTQQNTHTHTPQYINTHSPKNTETHSNATSQNFMVPPPTETKRMTEHILNELTRLVVDCAKGRYLIKLDENAIRAAIASSQVM